MARKIIWLTPDRFDLKPDKSTWIEMIKVFIEKGYDVTLLTSKSKSNTNVEQEYDKFTTYIDSYDIPYVFRFSVLFSMFFWIKKHASTNDIIIMNQDGLLLIPFLTFLKINNIHLDVRTLPVDMHTIKDRLDKLLYWTIPLKLFGRRAKGYSFITNRLKQELEKDFSLNIKDYTIWQSGVSTTTFYPKSNGKENDSNIFRLFYHGTISVNRGIGLVIEAIALLDENIAIEFIIIGNGSGLEELKFLTNKLSLNDKVNFRGFIPYHDIADEISKADICICPLTDRLEWHVSSPIKVFEYMACGKPMILTPIPAHLDVVSNSPYVIWTEGFEPKDFRKAIMDAFTHRDSLKSEAKSAPDLVKASYEWRSQANKLESYLSKKMSI